MDEQYWVMEVGGVDRFGVPIWRSRPATHEDLRTMLVHPLMPPVGDVSAPDRGASGDL